MTSSQESSKPDSVAGAYAAIESLAGAFHPHAIEIQDFSHYALVIDLRSQAEYEADHLPGAVCLELPAWPSAPLTTQSNPTTSAVGSHGIAVGELLPQLAAALARVKRDQAILVYCGSGGLASAPVAEALRSRGWTVDVLPGGWINYRRWVLAGLEVLPRLVPFRVIACTLGSETARVLRALRSLGHQVLDLESLAGFRRSAFAAVAARQPAQALFDSLLVQTLRTFDPALPVWVGDTASRIGSVALPGALTDALAISPAASLRAPPSLRAEAWAADELRSVDLDAILKSVACWEPAPPAALFAQWQRLAMQGRRKRLLASLLCDFLDPRYQEERAHRSARQHALTPLTTESMAVIALAQAVRQWAPRPPAMASPATT